MRVLRRKVFFSLGSVAAILLLSSVISILEYRRMSDYVSELIASNIRSINHAQKLSDVTQEYNHQMLAVVVQNDISLMPEFDMEHFKAQFFKILYCTFNNEVFLADSVDTGEWFFGTLQPSYKEFRADMNVLNESIYNELSANSSDFDAGFYRSIIPSVVSVGAGLLLILLLLFFTLTDYVRPINKMADGLSAYRTSARRYNYVFDGDDQLAEINEGITEVVEENIELKSRLKTLREERNQE